jgi:hypothetical protein
MRRVLEKAEIKATDNIIGWIQLNRLKTQIDRLISEDGI